MKFWLYFWLVANVAFAIVGFSSGMTGYGIFNSAIVGLLACVTFFD